MRTAPGFLMESQMFSLKFMSASQQGQLSYLLENETDWKDVMHILLDSLDAFPTNNTEVEKMGSDRLEVWALTQEGGDELELKVEVEISEKIYFFSDTLKSLRLIFNDMFNTVVLFNVRRKKVMKSLKTLAAEAVSTSLRSEDDIYRLDIPRCLYKNMETAYKDSWRVRFSQSTVFSDFLKMSMDIQN